MMIRIASIAALLVASPAMAAPVLLKLKAALDTPSHYCIDLIGHDADVDVNAPIQVHSCKEGYAHTDQEVDDVEAPKGRLRVPTYDRCLASVGAKIVPQPCSGATSQVWAWGKDGTLRVADGRCLTVGVDSRVAGSPEGVSWKARDLGLENCSAAAKARQQWMLQKSPVR